MNFQLKTICSQLENKTTYLTEQAAFEKEVMLAKNPIKDSVFS